MYMKNGRAIVFIKHANTSDQHRFYYNPGFHIQDSRNRCSYQWCWYNSGCTHWFCIHTHQCLQLWWKMCIFKAFKIMMYMKIRWKTVPNADHLSPWPKRILCIESQHNICCHQNPAHHRTKWTSKQKLTPEKVVKYYDKYFYLNIHELLVIMATLPVTSCECKGSISLLWHIKTMGWRQVK